MRLLYWSWVILASYLLIIIGSWLHAWVRKREQWVYAIPLGVVAGMFLPIVPSVTVPFVYIGWSVKEWWKERREREWVRRKHGTGN